MSMNLKLDLTDPSEARNLKDFITVYNKITESCFNKCISNFNTLQLSSDESDCVMSCMNRFIKCNHRLMQQFVEQRQKLAQEQIAAMTAAAAEQSEAVENKSFESPAAADTQGSANS